MLELRPLAHAIPDRRVALYVGGGFKSLTIEQAQSLLTLLEQAITDASQQPAVEVPHA